MSVLLLFESLHSNWDGRADPFHSGYAFKHCLQALCALQALADIDTVYRSI